MHGDGHVVRRPHFLAHDDRRARLRRSASHMQHLAIRASASAVAQVKFARWKGRLRVPRIERRDRITQPARRRQRSLSVAATSAPVTGRPKAVMLRLQVREQRRPAGGGGADALGTIRGPRLHGCGGGTSSSHAWLLRNENEKPRRRSGV
jgi:hypothetical protein